MLPANDMEIASQVILAKSRQQAPHCAPLRPKPNITPAHLCLLDLYETENQTNHIKVLWI